MPARNGWVRWGRRVGIVLGLGVLIRITAPSIVAWRIEALLEDRIQVGVEIDELDLDLTRPGLVAHGVHTTDEGTGAVDRLSIERLELTWEWSRVLRLRPRAHIVVTRPEVGIDLDASRSKVGDMRGVTLERLASLTIEGGRIDIEIRTATGTTPLPIHGVDLTLASTDWDAGRHADLAVTAGLGETGSLQATGMLSTVRVAEEWSLEFELSDFEVASLNTVWMDLLEMDVERGALDVHGRLRRRDNLLKGELTPRFRDLLFLGETESARHGIGEALFGHMLSAADSTIEIDRRIGTGTGATLQELFATDWEALIAGIIQRGYGRRLSTLRGYKAEIGDVEVEFDKGVIVLHEIRLTRDTRRVGVPFLKIKRLEVRFDPEVTSLDAEAYKHVVIWEPELTFVKGFDEARSQLRFDPDWVDKISAMPFKTRDVVVHNGKIGYWDETAKDPIRLAITDLELVGSEMARGLHEPGTRWATVSARARGEGVAETYVVCEYEPGDVANARVSFSMEALPFEVFEPFLLAKAGVMVEGGKFGVSGVVDAANFHVYAELQPVVFGIHLSDADPDRPGVAFTRKVIERRLRRLGGQTLVLDYDYKPEEKAFGSFTQRLIKVAVSQTHRRRLFE